MKTRKKQLSVLAAAVKSKATRGGDDDTALEDAKRLEEKEREKELADFLANLSGYDPTIPDVVTSYQVRKSGLHVSEPVEEGEEGANKMAETNPAVKLISLAADKFLADLILDARRCRDLRLRHRSKESGGDPTGARQREDVDGAHGAAEEISLSGIDVASSLRERGVEISFSDFVQK